MAKRNQKTSKTQPRKNSQALEPRRGNGTTPFGISPFSVVKRFGEEMDRLFGDFGLDRNWIPPALTGEAGRTWAPQPEGANPNDATAKFHDGVLEVTMPARKPVTRAARKLAIQEGSQPKSKAKAA